MSIAKKLQYNNYITKTKMMLFARWMSICYADTLIDSNGRDKKNKGFNQKDSVSILNREDDKWWNTQLDFFLDAVYPEYVKNGSVKSIMDFSQEDNNQIKIK